MTTEFIDALIRYDLKKPTFFVTLLSKIQYGEKDLSRRKKLINNTNIPQYKIEAIARCIMPDILALFESEDGQEKFAEWKAQRKAERDEIEGKSKD